MMPRMARAKTDRPSGVYPKAGAPPSATVPALSKWKRFRGSLLRYDAPTGEAYFIGPQSIDGSRASGHIAFVTDAGNESDLRRWIGARGPMRPGDAIDPRRDLFSSPEEARDACALDLGAKTRPNPEGSGREPLPFPVIYTAVGILIDGKDYGQVRRVTKAQMSRAIQIATKARQREKLIRSGTRDLTAAGRRWVADKEAREPLTVAAVRDEFERLVDLTHGRRQPPGKAQARGGGR